MRKIVFAVIVLLSCSQAQATQYVDSLRICQADTHDGNMGCDSFLIGVMDGVAAASKATPYCIPDGTPLPKIKSIFVNALREDKASQNSTAGAVLLRALRKAFPCR